MERCFAIPLAMCRWTAITGSPGSPSPGPSCPRGTDLRRRGHGALGGFGLFGVEFFIKGDEVWFSEVSPRPHDTGLVTLLSQSLSEFELHARAFGPADPGLESHGPAASAVLLLEGEARRPALVILRKR